MIIGKKNSSDIIQNKYDVIIIGSGISGLTLANLQAKQGRSVLVLEKHFTAGGCTHTYQRKGFEWDVGLHYVGDVHHDDHPLRSMFDFITDKNLNWQALPDDYDHFNYPGKRFTFTAGSENFKKELLKHFPEEKKAIEKYLELIAQMTKTLGRMSFCKALPLSLGNIMGHFNQSHYFSESTYKVLRNLTHNEDLIQVLCGQWGNYGLPPKQSSFGVHAVVANHYLDGGAFPVGGSSKVAKTIVQSIEDHKGKVIVGAGVKKILIRNNTAYAVLLENGDIIEGLEIVSSIGAAQSYLELFDLEVLPSELQTRLQKVKPSVSYLSLAIGIDQPSSLLNHNGGNIWVYPGIDHDQNYLSYLKDPHHHRPPMIYISFPSLKDPEWNQHSSNKTSINILGVASYEWFEKWSSSNVRKRPKEYNDFKEMLVKPYFDALYKEFPQLKNKISYYEISTPLTASHYVNNQYGEIYGLNLDPDRFKETWLRPKTPINKFFLTGQDIVINGICGAMMSGVLTSVAMHPLDTIVQLAPTRVLV